MMTGYKAKVSRRLIPAAALLLLTACCSAQDTGLLQNMQQQQILQQQQTEQIQQQMAGNGQPVPEPTGNFRAPAPRFSMAGGSYNGTITLTMRAPRVRRAAIYYTTDGWTPTTHSLRYTGPVQLTRTTELQAIVIAPGFLRSGVTEATYRFPASGPRPAAIAVLRTETSDTSGGLPVGLELPLNVVTPLNSATAKVGDRISLQLAQDVAVNGITVAREGAPAWGTVTMVDRSSYQGLPGVIDFVVNTLELPGGHVPLEAYAEKEGISRESKAGRWNILPAGGAFVHGKEAEIAPGLIVTASVAKPMREQAAR